MNRRYYHRIQPVIRPRREFVMSVTLEEIFNARQSFIQSAGEVGATQRGLSLIVNRP